MLKGILIIGFWLVQQHPSPLPPFYKCHIAVVDSEGAGIGKAHVLSHRDPISTPASPDRLGRR
jgi:hypothetical protein